MNTLLDLRRLGADPEAPFPPVDQALDDPNGLLAWGGDLHPARLVAAYSRGIFPWYSEGQPILWWFPIPRCVIQPQAVYISKRTARRYNGGRFSLTADTAFERVIQSCSEPRDDHDGTWITPAMLEAFIHLHHLGYAHSIEVWEDSELMGGIYGVALGRVFFGESMFSRVTDASKLALIGLCKHLAEQRFSLLDCQVSNPHLFQMGATEIAASEFQSHLGHEQQLERSAGSWTETFLATNRWCPGPKRN